MNDDLVAQLRAVTGLECVEGGFRVTPTDPLSQAAADEIERLQGLLKASQAFSAKAASDAAGFKRERDALQKKVENLQGSEGT